MQNKCSECGATQWLQVHHKFPQRKYNKKLYGDLIHDPRNLIVLCYQCHLNEAPEKWTEEQFCEELGIEIKSKEFRK